MCVNIKKYARGEMSMHSIQELPSEKQHDFWCLLYTTLSEEVLHHFEEAGEAVVRKALRDLGHWQGRQQRAEHIHRGISANISSLFTCGRGAVRDPRCTTDIRLQSDEVRTWDQYTCPMANYWHSCHAERSGMLYCEEYMRALLLGYTNGKGQYHVSKTLADHSDLFCQLSAYLRPANLNDEERADSFGLQAASSGNSADCDKEYLCERGRCFCISLYRILCKTAGEAGQKVYEDALCLFETKAEEMLRNFAYKRGVLCNASYIQEVFPFARAGHLAPVHDAQANTAVSLFVRLAIAPILDKFKD